MPGFDPEAYLDSLEPIGWKLGLERMQKLCTLLGMPQHRFASVHVVGTNGKSSVTRMIAALLEAHGLSTGACLSPHPSRWVERVVVRGEQIDDEDFAVAVRRAADGAEAVDRGLEEGEEATQFEVATAAAFVALAAARVDVGVIEAGLGGRLDATNTIPSRLTVLTSIGLDHTAWLGDTELEIAAEKLAVLRDHSTLVLGAVAPEVEDLAERIAAERGARIVRAPAEAPDWVRLLARGPFQRRNFAIAMTAAEVFLGRPLDRVAVGEVAEGLAIPGRLELLREEPPAYVDVAHNPDGARALAEALPGIAGGMPVVACIAVLGDKDAAGIVAALAPAVETFVCSELPAAAQRRSTPAAELAAACEAAGARAEAEPDFDAALRRASAIAESPSRRLLLVTGSHYALAPARMALCDH